MTPRRAKSLKSVLLFVQTIFGSLFQISFVIRRWQNRCTVSFTSWWLFLCSSNSYYRMMPIVQVSRYHRINNETSRRLLLPHRLSWRIVTWVWNCVWCWGLVLPEWPLLCSQCQLIVSTGFGARLERVRSFHHLLYWCIQQGPFCPQPCQNFGSISNINLFIR